MQTATLSPPREVHTNSNQVGPDNAGEHVFIARQPILDDQESLIGYELLFRSGTDNVYSGTDGDVASSQTINRALHSIGLDLVVGKKKAFINFTRDLLLKEMYALLPPELCVVEVLENTPLDSEVVAACIKLKKEGYGLALDDVSSLESVRALVSHTDFIKVDFQAMPPHSRSRLLTDLAPYAHKLLAEKVETRQELEEAIACGCKYFQGFYFFKPEIMQGTGLPGNELVHLLLLRELNRPELDFTKIEQLIKQDVSLSHKLLRYLDSAALTRDHKVTSLGEALALMGERSLRKWGALLAVTSINRKKPVELFITCLVRAHFCEGVARAKGIAHRQLDMFLLGLLSAVDAAMDMPMEQVLAHTAVPDDVRKVLLKQPDAPKDLQSIYALAEACERGAWSTVIQLSTGLHLLQSEVANIYYRALTWANEVFRMIEE